MHIGIIGAGPAGIMASLEAKKGNHDVDLFDANGLIGRKLRATGSGRGNLSNMFANAEIYHGGDYRFVHKILKQYAPEDLRGDLLDLGIPTYATHDGWVYPITHSAANVSEILAAHLEKEDIVTHLEHEVIQIKQSEQKFVLSGNDFECSDFDRIVVAAGGKAQPGLGGKDSILNSLKALGQPVKSVFPALAPILTHSKPFSKIQGVRLDARVKLISGERIIGKSLGNIIFTKWGINGPGVMDISYLIAENQEQNLFLSINFIPKKEDELTELWMKFKEEAYPINALLNGYLPPRLTSFILGKLKVSKNSICRDISQKTFKNIWKMITSLNVKVEGVRGFEYCQVSTGGVEINQVNSESLESKIIEGMFFAGEILDIHGPCGGYNLQWAFSSGVIAGRYVSRI
ncbi:MAG: aminoacetone oxidase family FAD-binding enzyme [Anaerolineaceae bacterium]|nr:aminoacetone oxidase family FAD-binding enzyme [Anaerolineaceae bacterium]